MSSDKVAVAQDEVAQATPNEGSPPKKVEKKEPIKAYFPWCDEGLVSAK